MNTIMRTCLVVGLSLASVGLAARYADAAQNTSRICKPVEVGVFSNRIHVKCAPIAGKAFTKDIRYYAMAMSNAISDETLQVLIAAKTHNRNLRIWIDLGDYKSVPGCAGGDCRRLRGVALQ